LQVRFRGKIILKLDFYVTTTNQHLTYRTMSRVANYYLWSRWSDLLSNENNFSTGKDSARKRTRWNLWDAVVCWLFL